MLALAGTLYALYRTARCLGAAPAAALGCACALPVFLLSAGIYYLRRDLDPAAALPYLIGGLAGGLIGGKVYRRLSMALLRRVFAALILYGAVRALL